METRESTVVAIETDEDVDRLLGRFPELEQGNIVVTVRPEGTALLTAAEFFRLFSAARKSGVTLTISSDDPLRCELARMLGWSVGEPPETDDEEDSPTQIIPVSRFSADDLAAFVRKTPPVSSLPETISAPEAPTTAIALPEDSPSPSTAYAGGASSFQTVDRNHASAVQSLGRGAGLMQAIAGKFRLPEEEGRRRRYFLAGAIGALVLVLLILAGILFYVLPTATITIVPTEHAIAADLTYGLDTPGAEYDIKIATTPMSNTSVFDKTIPTTGARYEPDGTASGKILFTNPLTTAISLPAQSKITGSNGQEYLTQSAVTVPAADPFGALSFGSAAVPIIASKAGSGSNADPGFVVGQLSNGLFYTNREPVGGGTDKKIQTVSPDDIAALTEEAKKDLDGRVENEFMGKIGGEMKLVPDSFKKGEPSLTFTHQANEDATEVAVHATVDVNALTYDPAKLHEQARGEASKRLASQAGPDAMLLGTSLQISDPAPINDQQTGFSIHANATVRSVITDEERSRLASSLVGKDPDAAESLLHQQRDVANYQMTLSPSWLPQKLPELASRIRIELASKE
ncbi:MAG TPA: hypothetical protein VFS96_08505 [Nitrolancea sp.]|nr:hypothetical protein [Nitrolancea sp.]